jgi:hypothetical protein
MGPIDYHLGMFFPQNEHEQLCMSHQRYIENMVDLYKWMFKENLPSKAKSPLDSNDHPKTDTTEFLGKEGIQMYQLLIGLMQWAISIGHFDIAVHVMTMSSFRVATCQGHIEWPKCIVGYLAMMRFTQIRVLTGEPDNFDLEYKEYNWAKTVYGDIREQVLEGIPDPLGKYVMLSHYYNANLYHDMVTGRSVMGILHFMNKMTIDWYSKKQATVETATYGSEFIAACTCIDQVIDLRLTLHYLGVPIHAVSYLFGNNKTIVQSATQPHAKLHKWQNALSFH